MKQSRPIRRHKNPAGVRRRTVILRCLCCTEKLYCRSRLQTATLAAEAMFDGGRTMSTHHTGT